MYVTHHGQVYQARELPGGRVELTPKSETPVPAFVCAVCGAGADTAEKIPHKPSCPEFVVPAQKLA